MDALVMCGGAGTRLDAPVEKPLFEIRERAMVSRVCDALVATPAVDAVHAAVSPQTPATRTRLGEREDVAVVDTPGEGYVDDLGHALDAVGRPAVTVAADLPLLAPEHVERALAARREAGRSAEGGRAAAAGRTADAESGDANRDDAESTAEPSLSVCVPVALKERLGASIDTSFGGLAPTGLNVVASGEDIMHTTYDARLAVNVNRLTDAEIATDLLGVES